MIGFVRRRFDAWWQARHAPTDTWTLTQSNIYIVPTRVGFAFAATRSGQWFFEGLSPRAGIAVLRAARAHALLDARDYVAPDDIQAILPQTIAHRLVPVPGAGRGRVEQVRAMVEAVALP